MMRSSRCNSARTPSVSGAFCASEGPPWNVQERKGQRQQRKRFELHFELSLNFAFERFNFR